MIDKMVPNGVDHRRSRCSNDGTRRSRCEDVDDVFQVPDAEESSIGCCGWLLTLVSYAVVIASFPLSLCFCLKIVQVIIIEGIRVKDLWNPWRKNSWYHILYNIYRRPILPEHTNFSLQWLYEPKTNTTLAKKKTYITFWCPLGILNQNFFCQNIIFYTKLSAESNEHISRARKSLL